jgi:hypothetical protein
MIAGIRACRHAGVEPLVLGKPAALPMLLQDC